MINHCHARNKEASEGNVFVYVIKWALVVVMGYAKCPSIYEVFMCIVGFIMKVVKSFNCMIENGNSNHYSLR